MNSANPAPPQSEQVLNPYVGPLPFEAKDRDNFFGRDPEIAILQGLLLASRVTLFFAQSGAGKSSLLQAGIIPELTRQQRIGRGERARLFQPMQVLPIIRVSGATFVSADSKIANIYVFHTLVKLLPQRSASEIANWSLLEGVRDYRDDDYRDDSLNQSEEATVPSAFRLAESERANATLLIFDQFEEFFTSYPEFWQARTQFFQQLNEALTEFSFLHVLFSMREDYIAELTPYAHLLPDPLQHRFRMERMKHESALLAIRQPALRAGRTFAEGVAESLVKNLARVQIAQRSRPIADRQSDPTPTFDVGEFIEPVHLQIVCQQLWEQLPPAQRIIQQSDLQELGDVDQALTSFYTNALRKVTTRHNLGERLLRDWFSQKLITSARTRGLLYRDEATGFSEGLANSIVDDLRDAYLVRTSLRSGETWIELAHDRLIEPILNANQRWHEAFANPISAAFVRWQASGRADSYLLKEEALTLARTFAAAHAINLSAAEREFFEQSQQQARYKQEAAQRQRNLWISGVVIALLLAALAIYASVSRDRARAAALRNQSSQIARAAEQQLTNSRPDLALLLAAEALKRSQTADAISAIHSVFSHPGFLLKELNEHTEIINQLLWSGDGSRLVSVSDDHTLIIWDVASGQVLQILAHDDNVLNVRWNRDESYLLSWTKSGSVRIWQASSGQLIQELRDPDSNKAIYDAQWSPDEQRIATASGDGHVRIWEIKSGQLLADYPKFPYAALAALWNSDGSQLWVAGIGEIDSMQLLSVTNQGEILQAAQIQQVISDTSGISQIYWNPQQTLALTINSIQPSATLWNLASGEPLNVLKDVIRSVRFATWKADGSQFLLTDDAGYLSIYDANGILRTRLHSQSDYILKAEWDGSGKRILTLSSDGGAEVWNAANATLLADFTVTDGNTVAASLQPMSDQLATSNSAGTIQLWKTTALDELPTLQGHTGLVYEARLSQTSTQLLTASSGGTINIWDLATSKVITSFKTIGTLFQAKWSFDNRSVLAAMGDGTARLWDITSGQERAILESHDKRLEYANWLPLHNHLYIYTGSAISTTDMVQNPWRILVWDTDSLANPMLALEGHTQKIQTARWSKNETRIATASDDGTVRIWDAVNGQLQTVITHNVGLTTTLDIGVYWAEWVHNDQDLLTWSADGTARLWNTISWKPWLSFTHARSLVAATWNENQTRLATASTEGVVRLWSMTSGALLFELKGHTAPVRILRLSHDERYLLTADDEGFARIWNVSTGELIASLFGHQKQIHTAVWNQADSQVLTASDEGTARLWDAQSGNLLAVLAGHVGAVLGAGWIEDEKVVLTRGADGAVRRYFTAAEDLLIAACSHATRNLTQEEWNRFIGSKARQKTCPQLPLE